MFICGDYTRGQKKPRKHCKQFMLWGIGTGYCFKHGVDMMTYEHCKYFKRDSKYWTKNGKCKVNENELYV